MDEFQRRRIQQMLDDASDEEIWGDISSDENEDAEQSQVSNHDTDTEQSGYSDEDNDITRDTIDVCDEKSYHESDDDLPLAMRLVDSYYGKDGTKWNREKPLQIRRAYAQNVLTEKSGVKETARQAKTIVDSWYIFFPKSMLEIIVKCTNVYIQKVRPNFTRERDASDTNIAEIKAVIGILYMIGKSTSIIYNYNIFILCIL